MKLKENQKRTKIKTSSRSFLIVLKAQGSAHAFMYQFV